MINRGIHQPNYASQKTVFTIKSSLLLISLGLMSGCSSLNIGDASYQKGDYRETQIQLTKDLEVPPNLISPVQAGPEFYSVLNKTKATSKNDLIPSYTAKGLRVNHHLGQRWLEIDSTDSQKIWKGVLAFFSSMGMTITEKRKDTGFIKTDFVPRKEIVPTKDQGALTKMFNSFRTEYADGAFDRITAQVVTDEKTHKTRIYFYDSMIFTSLDSEGDTSMGNSKIKPYSPLVEAQVLYKALIFFGATQAQALQQIQLSEHHVELVDGDTEFDGIQFKANIDESWAFFKAMVYRAGWSIDKSDENEHQAWVNVPKSARIEESLANTLAFWRDASKNAIPDKIFFSLKSIMNDKDEVVQPENCLLKVKSLDVTSPLTASKRHYIFDQLGFIQK